MRDPHRLLGLGSDATPREVQRAYARQLKTTRPDGDPAAFQRLHEAYERALHAARERASRAVAHEAAGDAADAGDETAAVWESADASAPPHVTAEDIAPPDAPRDIDDIQHLTLQPVLMHPAPPEPREPLAPRAPPAPAPTPAPTPAPASVRTPTPEPEPPHEPDPPSLHIPRFLDALEAHFGGGGEALRAWLEAEPALWNVSLKAGMAVPAVYAMAQRGVVASHDELEALQDFFGLDIRALHRLQLMPAWEHLVQTSEAFGLADRRDAQAGLGGPRGPRRGPRTPWLDAIAWRELRGPAHAPRRWLLRLLPMAPTRIHLLRATFHAEAGPELAERQLDPDASAYWRDAGDPHRYAPARLALGALRALALLAFGLLLALAAPYFAGDAPVAPRGERLASALWITGGLSLGWMLIGGYIALAALAHRALGRVGLPATLWSVGLMVAAMLVALAWGDDAQRLLMGLLVGASALLRLASPRHAQALLLWIASLVLLASLLAPHMPADEPKVGLVLLLSSLLAIALLLGRDLRQARRERRPLAAFGPGETGRATWAFALMALLVACAHAGLRALLSG